MTSRLLSNEDNKRLLDYLTPTRVPRAFSVLRLYKANPRGTWQRSHVGVATIERDQTTRFYYIRLYDLGKMSQLFEQQIFIEMEYTLRALKFATFHGEECPLGLAFASSEEAEVFNRVIKQVIKKFMNRANDMTVPSMNGNAAPNLPQSNLMPVNNSAASSSVSHSSRLRNTFSSIRKKVRITKCCFIYLSLVCGFYKILYIFFRRFENIIVINGKLSNSVSAYPDFDVIKNFIYYGFQFLA